MRRSGPVRSGRDQFFQLILPWQALYIHEGESVFMTQYAKNYDYGNLNNTNGAYGYRDKSRVNWQGQSYGNGLALEHTMYTSGENIAKYIADEGVDMNRTYNSTFFNFVDYRSETPVRDLSASPDSGYSDKYGPVVQDGEYVAITHSASYKTRFLYDAATTTYNMQQYYSTDGSWRDTIDEEYDTQLNFTNLSSSTPILRLTPATATTSRMWTSATEASAITATAARLRRSIGRRAPRWRPCACIT